MRKTSSNGAGSAPSHARRRAVRLFVGSVAALVVVAVVSFCMGPSSVSIGDIAAFATGAPVDATVANIIVNIRMPRVVAGLVAGAALSVAGALIQAVLDNPLASPSVIGINSGAGLAVLAVSACPLFYNDPPRELLPIVAFAGALIAAALVFAISARAGVSRLTVVLSGVAINAVAGAGMNTVLLVAPNVYVGSSAYLVGGFSGVLMRNLMLPALLAVCGMVVAFCLANRLNVLSLGREAAHGLGMRTVTVRLAALAVAALLAGCAVSFGGLIGFVGLMVPHAVRRLAGHDNRVVIPLCAMCGAAFTVLCDTVARTAFAPYELPVGILLSLVGGPFFIYLIMARKGFRDE